ncbi:MAG: HIT domain-containing protein [Candidatus Marinimicrobia bacterium]|nr:HIT domain-containing protein [Candidatus Neomarinimicrobiota bacterium]
MKKLWAPWRIDYILGPKEEGCFFCKYLADNKDEEHLILYRGKKAFVIMNYYPYNNGHLMVVPNEHRGDITELDPDTLTEMMKMVQVSVEIIRKEMKAEGFNIGINQGKVAGAGVDDHVHIHIVPRWTGDTNFMPVTGYTKVISEGLKETWKKLKKQFDKIKID